MSILVAYYSRVGENYFGGEYRYIEVGNTQKAADMIAEITGADLFKIEQAKPYSDNYRTCVDEARKDYQKKARPQLTAFPDSLDGYAKYILAIPITAEQCRWRYIPSWNITAGKERPFIPSVQMREADCRIP